MQKREKGEIDRRMNRKEEGGKKIATNGKRQGKKE
jgi:hypothetical protein